MIIKIKIKIVNSNLAILFGGAIDNTNNLAKKTFLYFIKEKGWLEIKRNSLKINKLFHLNNKII
jgi:hypothetical protein